METKWEVWLFIRKGVWTLVEESSEDFIAMDLKFQEWGTRINNGYPAIKAVLVQVDRNILSNSKCEP